MNNDDHDDTEGVAMQDADDMWHAVADKVNRIATCGKKIKARRYGYTAWQREIGAGDRCVQCKWSIPPQFMSLMTQSEREYLDCVAEVDTKKNGKLRSDCFRNRIEDASREWGWVWTVLRGEPFWLGSSFTLPIRLAMDQTSL